MTDTYGTWKNTQTLSQKNSDTVLRLGWLLADQVGAKMIKLGIDWIAGQRWKNSKRKVLMNKTMPFYRLLLQWMVGLLPKLDVNKPSHHLFSDILFDAHHEYLVLFLILSKALAWLSILLLVQRTQPSAGNSLGLQAWDGLLSFPCDTAPLPLAPSWGPHVADYHFSFLSWLWWLLPRNL